MDLNELLSNLHVEFVKSTDFKQLVKDSLIDAYKDQLREYYSRYNSEGGRQIKSILGKLLEIPEKTLEDVKLMNLVDVQIDSIKSFVSDFSQETEKKVRHHLKELSGVIDKKEFHAQDIADKYMEYLAEDQSEDCIEITYKLEESYGSKVLNFNYSDYSEKTLRLFLDSKDNRFFAYIMDRKRQDIKDTLTSSTRTFEGWLTALKINDVIITGLDDLCNLNLEYNRYDG